MMPVPGSSGKLASQPRQPLGLAGQVDHVEAQPVAAQRASKREEAGPELGRRRRRPPCRWRSPCTPGPARWRAGCRGSGPSAGSRAGSRGPSRRCSGPRRRRSGRARRAMTGVHQARNSALASRSGDTRRRSISSACIRVGDLGPVVLVARVDGRGLDAEPLRGLDLVAHEREQRRDEQRRPETLTSEEMGGEEVDGALAPPGPLDEQHPPAIFDQGGDRLPLTGTELRRRVAREQPQAIKQEVALAPHRHAEEYGAGVRRSAGVMPTGCWRSPRTL